jgi:hypothetical protein
VRTRLWILLALAALALLASSTPVFRDTHHSTLSTKVFDTILRQSYAGWSGFHACLPGPTPQHDLCWAELHKGNRFRQVGIDVDLSQSSPVPKEIVHRMPWTRAIIYFAEPSGHGSANTLTYGWELLMSRVAGRTLPSTFFDVGGDHAGYPPAMFAFRCTGRPALIHCRNSLGDEVTYTPTGS